MQEVVINRCFGGFGLSHMAIVHLCKLSCVELFWEEDEDISLVRHYYNLKILREKGKDEAYMWVWNLDRDDPALVETVIHLGDRANGSWSELKVVEIPDDVKWEIKEYDGMEHVAEIHRTWS